MTHTLTRSLTLAASLKACTEDLVYSLPTYFLKHRHTLVLSLKHTVQK